MGIIPHEFKRFNARLMSIEFYINSPDDLHAVSSYVHDALESGGKRLKVEIKAARGRSLPQNQLMWKWLTELSMQIKQKGKGYYPPEDLHEYMKVRFCPQKQLVFGSRPVRVTSTAKLDTGEMTHYLNQIHEWAVNAGFNLTIPEDSQYMELIRSQNA